MPWGAAAAAVASVAGSAITASGAKGSAKDLAKAQAKASNAQEKTDTAALRAQAPYQNAGTGAVNSLSYLLGVKPTVTDTSTLIPNNVYNALNGFRAKSPNVGDLGSSGILKLLSQFASATPEKFAQMVKQYGVTGATYEDFKNAQALVNSGGGAGGVDGSSSAFANVNKDLGDFGSLSKSFSMDDYQEDPGYKFRLSEGQKALDRSASARGGLFSGAAGKALTNFNQESASQEYGKAYDRYNTNQTNLFNRLSGLAGTGQTAANNASNINVNAGNAASSAIAGQGNAIASGNAAANNAWSTGLSSIGNSFAGGGFSSLLGSGGSSGYGINSSTGLPTSGIWGQ